ncbi:Galactofuranose ABC transporter, ATP-binding protein [Olavius sp. associated proteobacterium Delta 1]|nr:Galactofuranose ABC transporter, ATP-binding protein [Olavius sp. associated proteobacterium Delta 1]
MTGSDAIVTIQGLSKEFPGVKALSNVDFTLRRGEIHGLMGENGAGKSTLIKVLTGLYAKDAGDIFLDGQRLELNSPEDAPKLGISTVYQEINLIPALSVAENIYLGREPTRFGGINWKAIHARAKSAIKKLDLDIDVTLPVSVYSVAVQQLVAITRGLDISAKVLILDEPTSSLDAAEVDQLFSVLRKLRDEGMAILFITHFIDQTYEITDRITVLRNGERVGQYETKRLPRIELIGKMLGRDVSEFEGENDVGVNGKPAGAKEIFYQVRDMERKGSVAAFDLDICKGEVLGLAGLLGSGRSEIARLLFGIDRPNKGKTTLNGRKVSITSPRKAIAHYFAFCPEDRKTEGIISDLTVRENIILAIQARDGIFKTIPRKKQEEIVDKYIRALDIKTPGPEQILSNLSGGNQQKVVIARWLASQPEFLILDEPTRGIDVGAKAEIEKLIVSLSKENGMAILFISSELEEVIRCSDRVAVLRDRKKLAELTGDQIEEKTVMHIIANEDVE